MKAAQIEDYGHADEVKVVENDRPVAQEGQVLIEVHASSLNPFDSKLREGYMKEMIPLQFPVTLGGDIAGIVTEAADGFAVGDKVYGQAGVVGQGSGALAEYATTPASRLGRMPSNLSFNEAASLVLVGVSALQALTEHLNLQTGQKIIIQGGSGGIGSIAIQLAKHIGAYVAATTSAETVEMVKNLGADEAIDYETQNFEEIVKDYDAVFDTVGGDIFEKSLQILKPGGIAVSMVAQVDKSVAKEHGVTAITQSTQTDTARLDELTKLIEAGIITPQVTKVFPLDQIQEAFEARESGGIPGKVVIEIKD